MAGKQVGPYERDPHDWYVEEPWVSARLFQVEPIIGDVLDPWCGGGNVVMSARAAGLRARGSDLIDRGFSGGYSEAFSPPDIADFTTDCKGADNIIGNPPFFDFEGFCRRAVDLSRRKCCVIFPVGRLNAAGWLRTLPCKRIWLLTPRPSMPPGEQIKRQGRKGSGTEDYCWLVFDRSGRQSRPVTWWLHKDERMNKRV